MHSSFSNGYLMWVVNSVFRGGGVMDYEDGKWAGEFPSYERWNTGEIPAKGERNSHQGNNKIICKPCSSVTKTKESSLPPALMLIVENDSTSPHHRENYQKHIPGRPKAPWEKVQSQISKTLDIEHAL